MDSVCTCLTCAVGQSKHTVFFHLILLQEVSEAFDRDHGLKQSIHFFRLHCSCLAGSVGESGGVRREKKERGVPRRRREGCRGERERGAEERSQCLYLSCCANGKRELAQRSL